MRQQICRRGLWEAPAARLPSALGSLRSWALRPPLLRLLSVPDPHPCWERRAGLRTVGCASRWRGGLPGVVWGAPSFAQLLWLCPAPSPSPVSAPSRLTKGERFLQTGAETLEPGRLAPRWRGKVDSLLSVEE